MTEGINRNKILIIITGSVACYKSLELIRLLKKNNYQLEIILTKAAEKFITPLLVSSISNSKVHQDLFTPSDLNSMDHINLSRRNDIIIVAPCSANFMAKISSGIADDLASATILASNKKIFLAPAMNEKMWNNKIIQNHLNNLINIGYNVIDPEENLLSCGEFGYGKMAKIEEISNRINNFFIDSTKFIGKQVIITAGATYEPIDPVRFIGNYSSGKQAIALAESFYEKGAKVIFIASNVRQKINLPENNIIRTNTTIQMLEAIEKNLKNTSIFISCAAVSDFKPKYYSNIKLKKTNNINNIELELNIDILEKIGKHRENRPQLVIGFAAESQDLIKNSISKAKKKNCDIVIANNINNGEVFGSDENEVTIVTQEKEILSIEKNSKNNIARKIIDYIISEYF